MAPPRPTIQRWQVKRAIDEQVGLCRALVPMVVGAETFLAAKEQSVALVFSELPRMVPLTYTYTTEAMNAEQQLRERLQASVSMAMVRTAVVNMATARGRGCMRCGARSSRGMHTMAILAMTILAMAMLTMVWLCLLWPQGAHRHARRRVYRARRPHTQRLTAAFGRG